RWEAYGKELMRIRDRHDREFALGPTHEEVITSLVRDELKSYKKLPLTLFQIQTKFRDELRPRFGLLRGREFIMKDAYSFHIDEDSLDKTYRDMYDAYSRIFTRLDLNYRAVEADGGSIGGSHTHEFMALADIGEDTIVYTDERSYAANIEQAECTPPQGRSTQEMLETAKISTPAIGTVKELADFLDPDFTLTTKTMVVKTDDGLKMIGIRGDQELNDVKVKAYFDTEMIDMAADEEITAELNAAPGSLGPVGSPIPVYLDYQVEAMRNYPVGANETGYHLLNVNHERDFEAAGTGDFRFIKEGETVADGSGPAKFMRGIEVGQV